MKKEKISFSKREQECLPYLLKGFTFKRIGRALGLSHRTIELYVKNMRMKVGAANKRELIAKIVEADEFQDGVELETE